MNDQPASHNKLVRYLIVGGASLMLIGFFLLPWATNSFSGTLGGGESATGFQMLWGDFFSSPILKQVDIVKSTPGPWLLVIPVVSILVLAVFFVLDRLHRWRRAYWLAVIAVALVSIYPLFRILLSDTVWVLLGDMAFSYHPRSSSGIGFFVTLIGILGLVAGSISGMLAKDDLRLGAESKVPEAIQQKI